MMSKSIEAPSSFKSHCESCPPKKYLAITLLVIAIVSVAAALLFHFQFKALSYTIGYGSGAIIALIASGYFALKKTPETEVRSQEKKPVEIEELDKCSSPFEVALSMQTMFEGWLKDEDLTNDTKWNTRYQIAEHYWNKFGTDKELITKIPFDESWQSRWGVMKQYLHHGATFPNTNVDLEQYFQYLNDDMLQGAKGLLSKIKPDENILLQSLKICQKKAKAAKDDGTELDEAAWHEFLTEYVKLAGTSPKGAEFIVQNNLPPSLRSVLIPPPIPVEIRELDQCTEVLAKSKFTSYLKKWVNDPDLKNDSIWTARYQIASHYWDKFGKYEDSEKLLPVIAHEDTNTRWGVMRQCLAYGAQISTNDEAKNQQIFQYFDCITDNMVFAAADFFKKFQFTEVIVIQSLKIYQKIAASPKGLEEKELGWNALFEEHAKQVKGKCGQVAQFIAQNKLPENLRKLFSPL